MCEGVCEGDKGDGEGKVSCGTHMSGATSMLATIVGALFVPSPTDASTAANTDTPWQPNRGPLSHECSGMLQRNAGVCMHRKFYPASCHIQ